MLLFVGYVMCLMMLDDILMSLMLWFFLTLLLNVMCCQVEGVGKI